MALLDKINYLTLPNKISVQTSSQSAAGVQNWKDGSSSGSVRTVGSSVQDTEYKIGQYAVTEGSNTKAQGQAAHAEGTQSTANGVSSHAEGVQTKALGDYSHAEGYYTQASGTSSHVEGIGTKSTHAYQHVFGAYNKLDSSSNSSNQKGTYVEIVGNGTNNNLTNARTLDWEGNEVLSGKITVGTVGTNPMDVATVSQLSDTKVTQSDLPASNANYRVLLSAHANNTTETDKVWKNEALTYNPTGRILTIGDSNGNHISIDSTQIIMVNSNEGSGGSIISKAKIDTWDSYTDTKNTTGSTNTSSKIFLVGATSQAANPQTYSHDTAYVGANGHLYSNSKQVVNLSDIQTLTNKTLTSPVLNKPEVSSGISITQASFWTQNSTNTESVAAFNAYRWGNLISVRMNIKTTSTVSTSTTTTLGTVMAKYKSATLVYANTRSHTPPYAPYTDGSVWITEDSISCRLPANTWVNFSLVYLINPDT